MSFTVELRHNGGRDDREVELYLDRTALQSLVAQFAFLKELGDHLHFFTDAWGGHGLDETPAVEGTEIINHLRITLL